jgi:hypothetical protein
MNRNERAQTLVIFAIAALALVFFIGLAVDSGSLYVTYGQLKRAVDAAAVAAANEFKKQEAGHEADVIPKMTNAAVEILKLQNLDPNTVDIQIRLCDSNFDGLKDTDLQTVAPDFYKRCPDTSAGKQARKLIWVRATQAAPLYFLHMLGFSNIPLTTESIAEAASVDMVIVIDTSESMGKDTSGYIASDFDPSTCNSANDCQPLKQAKDAAKELIGNLYDGYDRVAVVTFDVNSDETLPNSTTGTRFDLGENDSANPKTHLQEAMDAIDTEVVLHDDAPTAKLIYKDQGTYNPVWPEDSDGDGSDVDQYHLASELVSGNVCDPGDNRWDTTLNVPCDASGYPTCTSANHFCGVNDVWDMNGDNKITAADIGGLGLGKSTSIVSTCTGCGMKKASNILRTTGRTGSVWVIIFLSDGVPNMSDTKYTDSDYSDYPNGFCTGGLGSDRWTSLCTDWDWSPRWCIDATSGTCPDSSTWDGAPQSLNYSALDYALDMTDAAALTKSTNLNEPGGNEITIYSVGLGAAGQDPFNSKPIGEQVLRYMAAVGDDGDRETDPCRSVGPRQDCGQYYYAASGNQLTGIFMDISSRIYTRISE